MNEIVKKDISNIEEVLIKGDLAQLTPEQRVNYYQKVCQSLGLNPLTRPFDYITLNGRLTLYAKKDAADQLRRIYNISIDPPQIQIDNEWIIVTISGRTPDGRTDAEIGVVNKKDMQGNYGNALMKAVTKAKRRLTLSICGLGWLDETEIETIPDAKPALVSESGEIVEQRAKPNGKRPYSPGELRDALLSAAEKMPEADVKKISEVTACLEYVFMSKDKRRLFTQWLCGKESMKDIDKKLIAALHRWLKPVYHEDATAYIPQDEFAGREANDALDAYMAETDQGAKDG